MTRSHLLVGTAVIGVAVASAAPAAAQTYGPLDGSLFEGVSLEAQKKLTVEEEDTAADAQGSEADAPSVVTEAPTAEEPAPETPVVTGSVTSGSSDLGTGPFGGIDVSGQVDASVSDAGLTGSFDGAFPRFDVIGTAVPADPELIVRGDVGIDGAVDVNNTLPSVVQMFIRNNGTGGIGFNCTGTMINPRTVLTAAHCVNSRSSEAYGTAATGQFSILIGTGVDTSSRIFSTLNTGASYAQGGAAQSSDVIIHPSGNQDELGLPFPWADVAMIALDEPITDVGSMPLLLTPLDQLTHLVLTGYGTNGTGEDGGIDTGSPFLRRIGENMLGAIATQADFIDAVFPAFAPSVLNIGQNSQALYFLDFDNPNRTPQDGENCIFSGTNISCTDLNAVLAIDYFAGDALPQEAGTAPGDSGSPLIVDELYDFPVIAGVLSGGYDFFGTNNRFGDVSFYNPLYPFFEFISENTPYKYVTTAGGDGNWSDPEFWTQELDPGFFVDDGNGNLVNGVPAGDEPGVLATGPKLGTILGQDVADFDNSISPNLPPIPPLPQSSVLLGEGSTGFVPNNTDGVVGTSFENPALYFDVLLTKQGTVTVDMDVEIDRLTIANVGARFVLPEGFDFSTMIGVEQGNGFATIDGNLNARLYSLNGGVAQGTGTIATGGFFNVAGVVAPAGRGATGTLTIDGNYIQTSAGTLAVEIVGDAGSNSGDRLDVTGTAVLGGTLLVSSTVSAVPQFGSTFTVLSAGVLDGDFDETQLVSKSTLLQASSSIDGNNVIVTIGARRITDVVLGSGAGLGSLGSTLDALRFGGRYAQHGDLFGIIDAAMPQDFLATLAGFTPTSAFAQTFTANGFAQRFTGQIAQRTLSLRGAGNAAAGFSRAGSASFAQAGIAPTQNKLGFFGSVSGSYLNQGEDDLTSGTTAFEHAAFTDAGELTFGMDYRASSKVAVGVAVSNVRNSASSVIGYHPLADESMSVAGYAAFDLGKAFADMHFGTSTQSYALQRASQGDLSQAFRMARGSAEGQQTFLGMRFGYAMAPARGVTFGPVASLDYVRSDMGGYSEFDAGAFGLNVDGRTFHSLGAKLGAMAAIDTRMGDAGSASFFGSVAYARELADTTDVVTASFMGAEDLPFQIVNQLDPEWVSVNAGAELNWSDNFSSKLSVTSDLGRGALTNNQANVALNWKF